MNINQSNFEKYNKKRCNWVTNDLLEVYHDTEWGVPLHNDKKLFEFLLLDGAQAGLSWSIILKKRDAYKKAFDQFNPKKISTYSKRDVSRLLKNDGIVRNRKKIESAINNDQIIVSDWSNSNKPLFQAIMIEKTIMSVLIFLVVLIAMFNIMVMISMTVDDKEKDIAILRTLGFTSYDISQIFFLQGAMNATLGIILGIILAFLGLNNLQTIETFISVIFGFNF